jgi:hypothetical protein
MAVGQVNNGDGSTVSPLTERWNGTTWMIQDNPQSVRPTRRVSR